MNTIRTTLRISSYLALLTTVLSCGLLSSASATDYKQGKASLVGAWIGDVTIVEPQSSEGFPTLFTFHRDKTVLETKTSLTADSPLGPLLATPGHGAWKRIGKGQFAISFKFYVQGAQGNPAFEGKLVGINNIHYIASVSENGKNLSAEWKSALIDPNGNLLFEGAGTFNGKRIEVARLPD